jgi:hypothetical protein
MRRFCLISGAVLLFLSGSVQAAPSVGGETGNLMTPSADMLRQGQFHIGWNEEAGLHGISVGVPVTNCLEINLGDWQQHGEHRAVETGVKYSLQQEGVFVPGIAVGAEDISAERRRSFYVVASKTLPYGFRIHAGAGNGRFQGGFAALEMRLMPRVQPGVFPDMAAFAEHVDGHASYGLRLSLLHGAKFVFGIDGHRHFAGLSYNFY